MIAQIAPATKTTIYEWVISMKYPEAMGASEPTICATVFMNPPIGPAADVGKSVVVKGHTMTHILTKIEKNTAVVSTIQAGTSLGPRIV